MEHFKKDSPFLKGYGLRPYHYLEWLKNPPKGAFVIEAITENYLGHRGGPALYYLDRICDGRTVFLHGVSLNIGAAEKLDMGYLDELSLLIKRLKPTIVSDHLSFSAISGKYSHSLLPLPRNQKTASFLRSKIHAAQEALSHPLVFENISRYVNYKDDELSEMEFAIEALKGTGAKLLLDVNNLYVTCFNEGSSAMDELLKIPKGFAAQYHIAGHETCDGYLFDTHSGPILKEVWQLLDVALDRVGERPVVLERDDHNPLSISMQDFERRPRYDEGARAVKEDARELS